MAHVSRGSYSGLGFDLQPAPRPYIEGGHISAPASHASRAKVHACAAPTWEGKALQGKNAVVLSLPARAHGAQDSAGQPALEGEAVAAAQSTAMSMFVIPGVS